MAIVTFRGPKQVAKDSGGILRTSLWPAPRPSKNHQSPLILSAPRRRTDVEMAPLALLS